MITKLIGRVFSGLRKRTGKSRNKGPRVIPFKEHGVARSHISSCALSVTDTLQDKGHSAFVVGGAVRDLLLKRSPKDFDVATSATPEEVRANPEVQRVYLGPSGLRAALRARAAAHD